MNYVGVRLDVCASSDRNWFQEVRLQNFLGRGRKIQSRRAFLLWFLLGKIVARRYKIQLATLTLHRILHCASIANDPGDHHE